MKTKIFNNDKIPFDSIKYKIWCVRRESEIIEWKEKMENRNQLYLIIDISNGIFITFMISDTV